MSLKDKNPWAKYMPKGNFEVLTEAMAPLQNQCTLAEFPFLPPLYERSMEFILLASCRPQREKVL